MSLDILDAISRLAPIITNAAGAAGKAQDTNAIIGNNAADNRPTIVANNLRNARIASMMKGYTKPTLHWGGPGSVARGEIPTMSGGYGADSPDLSALYDQVQKDALNQAHTNYGIKDPSASSGGAKAAGDVGTALSILGALKNLKASTGATPGDPTYGGLIQGNKPPVGGTGFPDVPAVGGAPSHSGMASGIPGYFRNPDGTLVPIPGDPANGGGYGGGLFGGTGVPDVDNPGEAHD